MKSKIISLFAFLAALTSPLDAATILTRNTATGADINPATDFIYIVNPAGSAEWKVTPNVLLTDAGVAFLESPTLTGDPKVPTASPGDNDASAASTAFVKAAADVITAAAASDATSKANAAQAAAAATASNASNLGSGTVPAARLAGLRGHLAIPALDFDWQAANTFSKTLSANATFTFSNLVDGENRTMFITNTAGNYTVTWPAVTWSGGVTPVQTTGAKTDIYTFIRSNGIIYGTAIQNF